MNYRTKRINAKISVYTMAKELGLNEKTYREVESGLRNLQKDKLNKFMEVIEHANDINFNRKQKMLYVDEWYKNGEWQEDMKAMGFNQKELAEKLGVSISTVSRFAKHELATDDVKEKIYDFLKEPLNKKIEETKKKESKTGLKRFVDSFVKKPVQTYETYKADVTETKEVEVKMTPVIEVETKPQVKVVKSRSEKINKPNKLTKMNDILFNMLEVLSDDERIKNNASVEIARSNAMSNVSKTMINSIKTSIQIMELKEKTQMTLEELNETLGVTSENN